MDIAERIERLEKAVRAEESQRDWLLSVNWSVNGEAAQDAVRKHEQVIDTYRTLIDRLKERQ